MADPRGSTERRKRARRLTDVHPPGPGHQAARPARPQTTAKLDRAGVASFICLPALALLALTAAEAIGGGRSVPDFVIVLAIAAWLACLTPVLGSPSRYWLLSDLSRMRTIRAVRRGLDRNEFELHYQPQVNVQTGIPYGVEGLLRWRRGDRYVPPGDFLPAIESNELIRDLTGRVLEMALSQAAAWHRDGRSTHVSINLAAASLSDHRIVEEVAGLLSANELPPDLIILEVTETTVLENPEQTRAVLDAIDELGVAISIDDFGVGYSSLLWLRIFPIAEVKIDRSFVSRLPGEGRAFVEGVVRLARDLEIRVVAEGIEDEPVLRELHALGCEAGQGFLFARPMPANEVGPWLDAHRQTDWGRREATISIDPQYDQIAAARDLVEEQAVEAGMAESDVWDVRVAVTEALANAIEHGALADDNLIHLRIVQEREELRLEISGGGRSAGVVPEPRGPERGRGISIMTGMMDRLDLTQDRDQNLIRLAKSLRDPAPEGPAEPRALDRSK